MWEYARVNGTGTHTGTTDRINYFGVAVVCMSLCSRIIRIFFLFIIIIKTDDEGKWHVSCRSSSRYSRLQHKTSKSCILFYILFIARTAPFIAKMST